MDELVETTVDDVLELFVGKIQQTPPMFSAVKVNGKRLYEYAFEGKEIERPSREVTIYSIVRTSPVVYDEMEKTLRFSFDLHLAQRHTTPILYGLHAYQAQKRGY